MVVPYITVTSNMYGTSLDSYARRSPVNLKMNLNILIRLENVVTSSQPDRSDDAVASPPPDPQPAVALKTVNDSHPSKAWYILPVFFGYIGRVDRVCQTAQEKQGYVIQNAWLGGGTYGTPLCTLSDRGFL